MSEWVVARLGDHAVKIGSGATPRGGSTVYQESGVALIRSQNVIDNSLLLEGIARISDEAANALAGVTVEAGDVLINITGDSVARTSMVDPEVLPARVNQHVAIIRTGRGLHPEFLQKFLVSPMGKSALMAMATAGGTRNALTKAHLASVPVPVPPLSEQQAIAEVLGALDEKIAANTKLAATADELISVLFRDSIEAERQEVQLLSEFKFDFGEPFSGGQFSEPGTGRPLIRIRDLKTFTSQVWTTESRTRETMIEPGDVIVGMDAEFRATNWLGAPGLLNQRVCRVSHAVFGNALVREALRRPLAEVENEKSATTVIHLNKSDLARKSAMIPVGAALQKFENTAESIYAALTAIILENRTLAETRDALLPQLMSGKIRVRDAEKLVSEAGA